MPALGSWLVASALAAAPPLEHGIWQALGPGPATNGQVENIGTPDEDDFVVGAVHALAVHPSDPDIVYLGATNGGVWKTTDATAAAPSWTPLTDDQGSLSIGALELDPTDGTHQTLVAGIGGFSSLALNGPRTGLLRTTDGGDSWTAIGADLVGGNVSGVAPRGSTIVVSVNDADSIDISSVGIFRSTDTGATFSRVSLGNGSTTGLPSGLAFDLVGDPSDASTLYTAIRRAPEAGGVNGIYKSTDAGVSWTRVSDAAIEALLAGDDHENIELAVGESDNVFAAIVGVTGQLVGVFRSGDGGATWTSMGVPTTSETAGPIGIHPGHQGSIHLSIAADPTDPDVVYVGGDRQPYRDEGLGSPTDFWPNSIGANDYTGRLFRGEASTQRGAVWTPLTHSGTANGSAPHADSREMKIAADGSLVEADDGGIYRRSSPLSSAGIWTSMIGDLQTTEYHGIAWDAIASVPLGGAQDTGTTFQVLPGSPTFFSALTADGGDPAVDNLTDPSLSTRFQSFQYLNSFQRARYDAANTLQSLSFPALVPLGGSPALWSQFYTPIAVNEIDGDRLVIGAANGVYESLDQGDTVRRILNVTVNEFVGDPILYGVPGNPDMLHFASGADVYRRTAAHPALPAVVTPPDGSFVQDLAIDPQDPQRLFAISSDDARFSQDAGASWASILGNLGSLDAGELRSLELVPGADDGLVLGTARGIFVAFSSSGFSVWKRMPGAPNAPVQELVYDETGDVLVAAIIGRGAWRLVPGETIFLDGFESGDTSAW